MKLFFMKRAGKESTPKVFYSPLPTLLIPLASYSREKPVDQLRKEKVYLTKRNELFGGVPPCKACNRPKNRQSLKRLKEEMTRLVLTWVGKPLAFELKPGLNTLGRNPGNDYRISDASVSSYHAEIMVQETEIKVRDLNSTNGTFINGLLVQEAELRQNDLLRLGTVDLRLEEVIVTVPQVAPIQAPVTTADTEIQFCSIHKEAEATYRCEVCTGLFCDGCVKVIGHDRDLANTICPSCSGQCAPFRQRHTSKEKPQSVMARLTQTMKFNIGRR